MIGKCCDNLDIKVAPNGSIFAMARAPVTAVTKLLAKHYLKGPSKEAHHCTLSKTLRFMIEPLS